jgi:hypothetical protein
VTFAILKSSSSAFSDASASFWPQAKCSKNPGSQSQCTYRQTGNDSSGINRGFSDKS